MYAAAVFTISDSRSAGTKPDDSGPAIVELLSGFDAACVHQAIIADEAQQIQAALCDWAGRAAIILTTGGTGIAARDVTPEAVAAIIDRPLPGFGEAMRMATFDRMPLSIISRGGAGIRGKCLIVYLPGSPRAVRDCLPPIIPAIKHALKVLNHPGQDCAVDAAAAARR